MNEFDFIGLWLKFLLIQYLPCQAFDHTVGAAVPELTSHPPVVSGTKLRKQNGEAGPDCATLRRVKFFFSELLFRRMFSDISQDSVPLFLFLPRYKLLILPEAAI
jgi:hypothetical protein